MRPRWAPVAVFASALLVLGGCAVTTGGVGHLTVSQGPSGFPSTSSGSSGPSKALPATGRIGRPQLRPLVLRLGDLPAGWATKPATKDTGSFDDRRFARCLGITDADPGRQATVSRSYTLDRQEVDSEVESYARPANVATQVRILHSPRLTPCFRAEFAREVTTSLPAGARLLGLRTTVRLGTQGVDRAVAAVLRLVVTLRISGVAVSVYDDAWFLAGRRVTGNLQFSSPGVPFDPAGERRLAVVAASRLGG